MGSNEKMKKMKDNQSKNQRKPMEKQGKCEEYERNQWRTNRKQGKVRKIKENQWKMKGKPLQTERQKQITKKNKRTNKSEPIL